MQLFKTPAATAFTLSVSLLAVASAGAADNDWFVGIDGGFAWLEGGSETTNGGAAFGGGGTVSQVDFDDAVTYGALLGRRIGDDWALAVSYDHVDADVSFIANYTALPGSPSSFAGDVDSDVLMLNVIYSASLSSVDPRLSIHVAAGAGATWNTMAVNEDFTPFDGVPNRTIAEGDNTSFAARGTLGMSYAVDERWALHGSASIFSLGDFETGDSRSPPVQPIVPYEVDAWGYAVTLGVSAGF